ncbi:MAG TPA: hypothetical protein VFX44_06340 [Solirubrobacterales bacterium]|nr:hypothetical protein [Solirubrobacterales bacterium]
MPDRHPHIKVTQDPELEEALRKAAPYLKPGMSVSQQTRELALIGSHNFSDVPPDDAEVQRHLEKLAARFENPESTNYDWEGLREGKADAWGFGR